MINKECDDAEPMKVMGKDGKIRNIILGADVLCGDKHTLYRDSKYTAPVCGVCNKILTSEEMKDAIIRERSE